MKSQKSYTEQLKDVKEVFQRFTLKPVEGVPLMKPIADNWEKVASFRAHPNDLLIATYPKAGTTWIQEMVDLILNNGDAEKCQRAPIPERIPFLEIFSSPTIPSGVELLEQTPSPRVIKTHLPLQLVPQSFWEQRCKVIYVARNAKDNLVSYFHFDRMNQTQPEPGPWSGYITKFMKGELSWGSWYDHVKGYWQEREKRGILYLFYEEMKQNPRQEIVRVMNYLGQSLPDDIIEKIVELTSFKSMKSNPMANYTFFPDFIFDHKVSPFMRKGEVGDWKNHFSEEESAIFDAHYAEQMKGSDIPFKTVI
ncbi:sulfotransferase 1C2 [Polyodon spathula]|uniref:sulfotransferase 1C2 n=1 Tax=Polyodon spathula TaxID=7913 RepID=UPI001B7E05C0|nr:sulfotransferase 1C2 [Polyodon spathula]